MSRAVVFCLLLTACSAVRPAFRPVPTDYPGELLPVASWGADFMWRQHVTARWGENDERSFDAVLQKRGDKLQLIGLSPLGQPGFVVTLRGGEVTLDKRIDRDLPFPARFMILDAQRAFGTWFENPKDGTTEREHGGERIVEVRRDGRLERRSFTRPGKSGAIRIEYSEDANGTRRAVLDNGWFGYSLHVETYQSP